MAPAVPRLRILSGASLLDLFGTAAEGLSYTLARTCRACLQSLHEHLLTASSWRKCRFSVPILAVTSDQRLRRHTRVEVRIRERRTVRHLVQVSTLVPVCLTGR
jgi:hypothetical protein